MPVNSFTAFALLRIQFCIPRCLWCNFSPILWHAERQRKWEDVCTQAIAISSVIGKVQCLRQKRVTPSRGLRAKGEMCTLQTGKLCNNAININYVPVLICRIASLGNLISLLLWSFVKVFAVSSYYWSYAELCMLTKDKSKKWWELRIFRDRTGVGLVKSLSLHLMGKRIKEILTQKHQYSAKN